MRSATCPRDSGHDARFWLQLLRQGGARMRSARRGPQLVAGFFVFGFCRVCVGRHRDVFFPKALFFDSRKQSPPPFYFFLLPSFLLMFLFLKGIFVRYRERTSAWSSCRTTCHCRSFFLVAEEDRLEDSPEEQPRRALLVGTAEPSAAVTLRSEAAIASCRTVAASKWAAKSGVPALPVPQSMTEKWEKQDLRCCLGV